MKYRHLLPLAVLLGSHIIAPALEEGQQPAEAVAEAAAEAEAAEEKPDASEQERLATENKLAAERLTNETNDLRSEITRLKMERELITERLALETAKRNEAVREAVAELEAERDRLTREGEIAKQRAEKLANELKALQNEAALEITRMQNEMRLIETRQKRDSILDAEPEFLKNPLREDGTLVISDRRVPLNGPVTTELADFVTTRIQYWNNKDRELPIFIVIDSSPGGSVMAGYRILKAMESSDAPVYVVVKSFAASMAAAICTLAEDSFAYPNAILLHHQISNTAGGRLNLTQQREFFEQSTRWWDRLATPIAEKMGVTTDEFIEKMYAEQSSGDWVEFADQAQKLKWVNHVVTGIEETSVLQNPDTSGASPAPSATFQAEEQIDNDGKPFVWLPRLDPTDVWFLHNPDGYFRVR